MSTSTTEELDQLRSTVRRLIEQVSPPSRVREVIAADDGIDGRLWSELTQLGAPMLVMPEDRGGLGLGPAAAAVVAEELGAGISAVPFLSSAVLATVALLGEPDGAASSRWLPQLGAGERLGAVGLTGPSGTPGRGLIDVTAAQAGDHWVLDGAAGFVLDGGTADVLIVATRGPDGLSLFAVAARAPGLHAEPIRLHDRTRRLVTLRLDKVRADRDDLLAQGDDAERLYDTLLLYAAAVRAADAAGGARRVHQMALDYAKQRMQFGRVIGSFQAVKHKLADMYVLVEGASAASKGAAQALTGPLPDMERKVQLDASYAVEAYVSVAGDAIQVHGGVGYTWEHECHLYFKRAQLDQALFGDASWLRARAVEAILGDRASIS